MHFNSSSKTYLPTVVFSISITRNFVNNNSLAPTQTIRIFGGEIRHHQVVKGPSFNSTLANSHVRPDINIMQEEIHTTVGSTKTRGRMERRREYKLLIFYVSLSLKVSLSLITQ